MQLIRKIDSQENISRKMLYAGFKFSVCRPRHSETCNNTPSPSYLYQIQHRTERHRSYKTNSPFAYGILISSIFSDLTELSLSSFKNKSQLYFHNVSALSKLLWFLSSECLILPSIYLEITRIPLRVVIYWFYLPYKRI